MKSIPATKILVSVVIVVLFSFAMVFISINLTNKQDIQVGLTPYDSPIGPVQCPIVTTRVVYNPFDFPLKTNQGAIIPPKATKEVTYRSIC